MERKIHEWQFLWYKDGISSLVQRLKIHYVSRPWQCFSSEHLQVVSSYSPKGNNPVWSFPVWLWLVATPESTPGISCGVYAKTSELRLSSWTKLLYSSLDIDNQISLMIFSIYWNIFRLLYGWSGLQFDLQPLTDLIVVAIFNRPFPPSTCLPGSPLISINPFDVGERILWW